MLWCDRCDRAIPDPDSKEVEISSGEYKQIAVCPWCGNEWLVSANSCSCGEWKSITKTFCPDCMSVIREDIMPAVKGLIGKGIELEDLLDEIAEEV